MKKKAKPKPSKPNKQMEICFMFLNEKKNLISLEKLTHSHLIG